MKGLRLIRLLAVAVIALAALLAIAVAVLFTIDLSAYRAPLEARVSRALGRPVALSGTVRVEPALSPTLTVRSVTIANPAWASDPMLAQAERISLRFAWWPLLQGRLVLTRLVLVGGHLHLETRADGTNNWMLAAPVDVTAAQTATAAGTDASGALPPASLPQIEVRRSRVDYRDGRSGVVTRLGVTRALLRAEERRPLVLMFDGTLRGQPLSAGLVGGPWSELVRSEAPWPVRLEVISRDTRLQAQGELRRLPEPRFDLQVHASGGEFDALGTLIGVRLPRLGPFELNAQFVRDARGYEVNGARGFLGPADSDLRFTVQAGRLSAPFTQPLAIEAQGTFRGLPFDLRLDGAPYPVLLSDNGSWPLQTSLHIAHTQLELDGAVQARTGDFAVNVRADGADVSSLEPLVGRDLPSLGPYELQGRLRRAGSALSVNELTARVGHSDARGRLQVELGGARPALSGVLDAGTVDLADFRNLLAQTQDSGNANPPAAQRRLPFELLRTIDAELRVSVGQVLGVTSSMDGVRAYLRLRDGKLDADPVSLRLAGEAITGQISVQTGGDVPTMVLVAHGSSIHYGPVLSALHVTQRLDGEAGQLDFALRGQGQSLEEIWHSAALRLETRNGDVTYTDPRDGTQVHFFLRQALATTGGGAGLVLDAQGNYREQPFDLHLAGDGLPELKDDRLPWHVRVSGTIADASFSTTGSVRAVFAGEGVDLQVRVDGPHLAGLNPVLGTRLPPLGPYRISGQVTDTEPGWRVQGLEALIGASDVSGDLRYVPGQPPQLTATLNSETLRLADLEPTPAVPAGAAQANGPLSHAAQATLETQGKAQPQGNAGGAANARAIPKLDFPVQRLRSLDLDLRAAARRVDLARTTLRNVSFEAHLHNGRLEIKPIAAEVWQGGVTGSLSLDASVDPPRASVALTIKGLNYAEAMGSLSSVGINPGTAQVALDIQGQGKDLRQALANAEGAGEFYGDSGQIDSSYLDLWASNLFVALLPNFGKKRSVELKCAVGHFDVKGGKAETRSLLLDVDRIAIKGVGSINLANEDLDLLLWPEPRDPSLLRLSTPVKVTGTLAHPSVSPQARGVVEDVAWLLVGSQNPFVLLLGWFQPGAVKDNPCVAALAGMDGKAPVEENVPPNPISKTKDFFRGLGRFLTEPFHSD